MALIVATTSLPFNCLMATNCKDASHAPFIYVFNIGVISNNTNRLWREFSIKQITEIVINIFLTTKERQSIRTIHILRHTGCEWGWRGGSLHHDGNTDIGMVGFVVPQRVEKHFYNVARSTIRDWSWQLYSQSGKSSGLLYAIEIKNVTTFLTLNYIFMLLNILFWIIP